MTDDDDDGQEEEKKKGDDSSGSGGWIFAILTLVGGLIFRYPKVMIPILLLGGLSFICLADFDDNTNDSDDVEVEESYNDEDEGVERKSSSSGRLGAKFDDKKYRATPVYEQLASSYNELPAKSSMLKYAPKRKNQGDQGSCTGWAISYAARTILQAKMTGENPDKIAFSPAYLFNQNTDSECDGAYPIDLLTTLKKEGSLPFSDFPYNEESCRKKPSSSERSRAAEFRIEGFQRLTEDGEKYDTDLESVKQYLANGSPVVISMEVGGSFMGLEEAVWHPSKQDYSEIKKYKKGKEVGDWGGHAMTAIGYDDDKDGGAIQIMNSWGEEFGSKGVFWLRYEDFNTFVREAYSVYPPVQSSRKDVRKLKFGLIENKSEEYIQLSKEDNFTYRTTDPIKKGTRFKVSVENDSPTYVYIFGKETDGSSYVLFPYNDNHSPYCGTSGVRVFPRKQSLEADNVGKRDSIAVVFSSENLDYKKLNSQINSSSGKTYGDKIKKALSSRLSTSAKLGSGGDFIELTSKEKDASKVDALIIEFDKE